MKKNCLLEAAQLSCWLWAVFAGGAGSPHTAQDLLGSVPLILAVITQRHLESSLPSALLVIGDNSNDWNLPAFLGPAGSCWNTGSLSFPGAISDTQELLICAHFLPFFLLLPFSFMAYVHLFCKTLTIFNFILNILFKCRFCLCSWDQVEGIFEEMLIRVLW